MNTIASTSRSPLKFFLLVFALSFPFCLAGAFSTLQLLPGIPLTALIIVFCPATAAVILVYRESRTAGVIELLKRSFDFKRIKNKIWYLPIMLLIPGLTIFQYELIRWMGVSLPSQQIPVLTTLGISLAMFIAAQGEELGWSGYAIDPMQDRWGAFSVVIGQRRFAWHFSGKGGSSRFWGSFSSSVIARGHKAESRLARSWLRSPAWSGRLRPPR